jgi:hypothetical protein
VLILRTNSIVERVLTRSMWAAGWGGLGGVSGAGCVQKFLLEISELLLTLYAREVLTGERFLLDPRNGVHIDAHPTPPTHPPHPPVLFLSHIS